MRRTCCMIKLTILSLVFCSNVFASPFLNVDSGGQLCGAKNVVVDGKRYIVEFIDGEYFSIFGYAEPVFGSLSTAKRASQVLLQTVFLDSTYGAFDTGLSLISGIDLDDAISGSAVILTPFYVDILVPEYVEGYGTVSSVGAVNGSSDFEDFVCDVCIETTDSTIAPSFSPSDVDYVYAYWTPVPEPSTIVLVFFGLFVVHLIAKLNKVRF